MKSIALVILLEASAWLHLILDGDPWPVEWAPAATAMRRWARIELSVHGFQLA